jgi:hypothetical protein
MSADSRTRATRVHPLRGLAAVAAAAIVHAVMVSTPAAAHLTPTGPAADQSLRVLTYSG